MAKRLKQHEFCGVGRNFVYDWRAWADGNPWLLTEGKDYTSAVGLVSAARSYARKNGLRCQIDRSQENSIVIQFEPR